MFRHDLSLAQSLMSPVELRPMFMVYGLAAEYEVVFGSASPRGRSYRLI
jgi:hypothetical protein